MILTKKNYYTNIIKGVSKLNSKERFILKN